MKAVGWPDNLFILRTALLIAAVVAVSFSATLSAAPESDSPAARYLAARKALDVITDLPPHVLASPDASLAGMVVELRGEILAVITPGQDAADSALSCLLLQTAVDVTVPLDYQQIAGEVQVGQRVAVLAKLSDDPQRPGHFVVEHLIAERELLGEAGGDAAGSQVGSNPADNGSSTPGTAGASGPNGDVPAPPEATDQDLYDPQRIEVWKAWIAQHNPNLSDTERDLIVRWVLYHCYNPEYDVHPDHRLIFSVILAESNFDPYCVSHAGAQGLMQLMPGTARGLGVDDPFYFPDNIRGGVEYLSKYLVRFRDKSNYEQCALALACYNAGEGAVARYGGVPPFPETRRYIIRVTQQFHDLYKAGYP